MRPRVRTLGSHSKCRERRGVVRGRVDRQGATAGLNHIELDVFVDREVVLSHDLLEQLTVAIRWSLGRPDDRATTAAQRLLDVQLPPTTKGGRRAPRYISDEAVL